MIIDSTILISLGLIERLELLEACEIPGLVFDEIKTESIKTTLTKLKFPIISPTEKSKHQALEILGDLLETGDSDIVASLLDFPRSVIATDDKRLRTVCKALGGKVTGTLGILIQSAITGKISKNEALNLLKKLNATGFRMSLELYEKIRSKINEI